MFVAEIAQKYQKSSFSFYPMSILSPLDATCHHTILLLCMKMGRTRI
jgi:hypothetical protein